METQVKQDSAEQKGEQTDLRILKRAVRVLAPHGVFFQAKPKLSCVRGAEPKAAKLSTQGHPSSTGVCGDSPRAALYLGGI